MTATHGSAICPHPRATERLCCLRKRQENETNMLDNVSWDTLYINNSKKLSAYKFAIHIKVT